MKKLFILCTITFFSSCLANEQDVEKPKKEQEEVVEEPLALPNQPVAVVIVGGGISGLSCAVECAAMGYKTVVCDDPQKEWREIDQPVSNWPGDVKKSWSGLIQNFKIQSNDSLSFHKTKVTKVTKAQNLFQITTDMGTLQSHALIIATGQDPKNMPFFSKSRFLPRPWLSRALQPTDTVIVIASDNNYLLTLVQLSLRVKKVYCFTRNFRPIAHSPLETLAQKLPNIEHILYDHLDEITTQEDTILLEYSWQRSKKQKRASWIVMDVNWTPNSKIVSRLVSLDSNEAIVTQGSSGQTSAPGLFSCGEVSHKEHISGLTAAAEGEAAAQSACQYLLERGILPAKKMAPSDKK